MEIMGMTQLAQNREVRVHNIPLKFNKIEMAKLKRDLIILRYNLAQEFGVVWKTDPPDDDEDTN